MHQLALSVCMRARAVGRITQKHDSLDDECRDQWLKPTHSVTSQQPEWQDKPVAVDPRVAEAYLK